MKLPAAPLDFLYVQLDPEGGGVGSADTTAVLRSGDGALLPAIEPRRWLPAIAVASASPESATLAEMKAGDWVHITGVSGDTITIARTETARALQAGEFLLVSLGAYQWQFVMEKLEHLEFALSTRFGGYDGVPQWGNDGAPDALKVIPGSPVSMRVRVNAGVAIVNNEVFRLPVTWTSGVIAAPAAHGRIDLVQAKLGAGGQYDLPAIKTGAESGSPSAPSPDADAIALGAITLAPAQASITAGNITDLRVRI